MADPLDLLKVPDLLSMLPDTSWLTAHPYRLTAGLIGGAIPLGMLWHLCARRPSISDSYGSAHFATPKELKHHGLYRHEGIYVGQAYGHDIRVSRSHLVIIGPSECGKTKSVGIGTEIEWPGSVLTLDLKGEHLRLSADARRARGNVVQVYEPRRRGSERINLLDGVTFGEEEEVQGIQRVSDHATDPGHVTMSGGALFFRGSNRNILEAVWLYLGNYADYPVSFASSRTAMKSMHTTLDAMSKVDHPNVKPVADGLKGLPLPKRVELWNSASDCLRVYDDPILAYNTDATTIDLEDLQFGEQPHTVYIRVTPDDARGALRSHLRLLFDQHLAKAGQRRQVTNFRHHELINMDDQFELGYLAAGDHTTAYYREAGKWWMGTFQSFEQLDAYSSHASILDNSKTWIVFRPNHTKSSQVIAEKLGKTTAVDERVTVTAGKKSVTKVAHERDLMTAFEVEHIPDYHAFIFSSGVPPILAQQVPYDRRELQ